MTRTAMLSMPLLQPAQAQKHVTVNEALTRLDGLVQLILQSLSLTIPPMTVQDGVCFGVPVGAVNGWAGQDGRIAIGKNGGWDFADPQAGWQAFVVDQGLSALHDGSGWQAGQVTLTPKGAGLALKVREIDHVVTAGTQSTTIFVIPANCIVFGVTGRVTAALTGTLTSWQLGNPGAVGRFGSGLGTAAGSFARGVLAQPTAYYAAEVLQLDATGGAFVGGTVRLAVHYLELSIPAL